MMATQQFVFIYSEKKAKDCERAASSLIWIGERENESLIFFEYTPPK